MSLQVHTSSTALGHQLLCLRKRVGGKLHTALIECSYIVSTNLLYINLSPKRDPSSIRQSADLKQHTASYVICRFPFDYTNVNRARFCAIGLAQAQDVIYKGCGT